MEKKKKKKSNMLISLGICALSCILLYNVGLEIMTTIQYQKEISDAKSLLSELEKSVDSLTKEKENLHDEEYVVRYARAKYLVGKDEEQVFTLPEDDK